MYQFNEINYSSIVNLKIIIKLFCSYQRITIKQITVWTNTLSIKMSLWLHYNTILTLYVKTRVLKMMNLEWGWMKNLQRKNE